MPSQPPASSPAFPAHWAEALAALPAGSGMLLEGDNADLLPALPDAAFQLAYLDPPFNTGRAQRHQPMRTRQIPADASLNASVTQGSTASVSTAAPTK